MNAEHKIIKPDEISGWSAMQLKLASGPEAHTELQGIDPGNEMWRYFGGWNSHYKKNEGDMMDKIVREQDPKETIETLKDVIRKFTGDTRSEEEKKKDRKKSVIKTILKEITKSIKIN